MSLLIHALISWGIRETKNMCTKVNIMYSFLVDLSKQVWRWYIPRFSESSSHIFQIHSLFRGIWIIRYFSLVWFYNFLYSDLEFHTNLTSLISQIDNAYIANEQINGTNQFFKYQVVNPQ